ncbi:MULTISPECIES: hypothetical protein [unclassified Sphingobacterium]|uniref:hypothetical protein n=1 Tax=unclassified Sphingobacterium TaxID=2609468 RepID=UPI0025EB1699|nr:MULTISPECIES: hypothetical protein [unclassified Sphingobacterium]
MKNKLNYKFYILLVLFLFSAQFLTAQVNRSDYDYAMKKFQELFNEKKPDDIYEQSSTIYKSK